MKKIAITLSVLFFLVHSYAQCLQLPYKPTFGVIGNADTTGWLMYSNYTTVNPSSWQFKAVASEIVPYLSVQSAIETSLTLNNVGAQTVVLYSPCVSLDNAKTYELKFSWVGLSPGFLNGLSVYLATDAPSYTNDGNTFDRLYSPLPGAQAPASDTFRLIKTFTDIPFGTTEFSVLFDESFFPPTGLVSGNYRIVFKSESVSRRRPVSDGDGYYIIESYLKNIVLDEAPAERLEIVSMVSPLSNCNLSDQTMTFKIKNTGYSMPASYNVCYQLSTDDGATFGLPICEPFYDPISYNGIIELSFTNKQSFSASLTLINAWVEHGNTLERLPVYLTTLQTIPYGCSFDDFSIFREWSIISEKTIQPDLTWHVPLDNSGAMSGRAVIKTTGEISNDRLVSGCFELEANTLYQISFVYAALVNPNLIARNLLHASDLNFMASENLKLYVGRSNKPDVSDITLMDLQEFNNTDSRTLNVYFRPTETGTYHFGFLAYSEARSAGIAIEDFSIAVAQAPDTVPIYMGFENYDNFEGWQIYSQNAIDNTGTPTLRGWTESTTDFFSGNFGLRTLSSPSTTASTSITTALENNNNWLISKPIYFEAGKPYEILYFRRAMTDGAQEILNIRVSDNIELQTLSESEPLFRDTTTSYVFTSRRVYYTPAESGTYFVTFQYNSVNKRAGNNGMSIDEINIQDSAEAQKTNISVIELIVPPPACQLSNAEAITLRVKNRTNETIPASTLTAYFSITNPAGVTTTRLATHPPFFSAIGPYEEARIDIRSVNMRAQGVWTIKGWISGAIDENPTDDTSAVVHTVQTGTLTPRYDMGFEPNQNVHFWSSNQTGNRRFWWNFITDPTAANTGTGVAYVAPSANMVSVGDSIQQFIISPCLRLSADTTYYISFFYRAAEEYNGVLKLNPVRLNTYVGTGTFPSATQLRNTIFATNKDSYKQEIFYYRPSAHGTNYIIFQAVSRRWSTGIYLDDIVIMDSASANQPNLSLNRIWAISPDNCNTLLADTLYVEIENKGFLDYDNPSFNIEFGGQTFEETWTGTVPTNTTTVIKLDRKFTTTWGENQVRIALNVLKNLSRDTVLSTKSIKTTPIRVVDTAHTVTFQPSQLQPWNNLIEPFSMNTSNAFEYWTFGGTGTNTFARWLHPTNRPGILASGCFSLEPNDPYMVVFQHRNAGAMPENLHVFRDNADGTPDIIFTNSNIIAPIYTTSSAQFVASGDGKERIRFVSNYNASAEGIYINHFTIKADTSAWPADAELVRIVAPTSGINLGIEEPITIKVANLNRRPLVNLHVYYSINGVHCETCRDSIALLNEGDTIEFTFRQRAYLGEYKTYEIVAWINGARIGDINHSNDTARARITNCEPCTPCDTNYPCQNSISPMIVDNAITIYPNPATTEVFIRSEKEISTLFIHDMRGQLIKEIRVNSTEYQLNTSYFPIGTYLFTVLIGNERVTQRVMINYQP
jgi:hypothetical protein